KDSDYGLGQASHLSRGRLGRELHPCRADADAQPVRGQPPDQRARGRDHHAPGLTLTDEGEMLYSAVSDVLNRLAQAEEALKNVREAPRGALKITSSHGIGTYWLVPRMDDFLKDYPEVEVHLVMEDRELDLAQREADIAIRMRAPVQADLIQRKLFTVHYHMYATKPYLDSRGTPQTLDDLADHTIIA